MVKMAFRNLFVFCLVVAFNENDVTHPESSDYSRFCISSCTYLEIEITSILES
jgi:hypothetical protein